jgi:hypothetical protein
MDASYILPRDRQVLLRIEAEQSLGEFVQVQPGTVYADGAGQDMRYCYERGSVWCYADGTVEVATNA